MPRERVFVYKNPTLLAGITYLYTWGQYSTMLRLITKLEAFLGVAQLLSQYGRRIKALRRRYYSPTCARRYFALLYPGR